MIFPFINKVLESAGTFTNGRPVNLGHGLSGTEFALDRLGDVFGKVLQRGGM
jgi:hypothetical protein